jgi:hypothetical protein
MRTHMLIALVAGLVCLTPRTSSAQTPALKALMREKLAHSQQLLGAMVTSNWAALEEHAVALRKVTTRPAWAVLQSPEYARQTLRFDRALDDLIAAARRKDLDEAPLAYTAVTLSCVQCHRHVARMRLADASAPARGPAAR